MNVSEIAKDLLKIMAEKFATSGKTEFPVSDLVAKLKTGDISAVLQALKSLESEGVVSLLGSNEDMLVKLIPEALAHSDHAGLIQNGLAMVGDLFHKK